MTIGFQGVLLLLVAACALAVAPGLAVAAQADVVRGIAIAIAPSVFATNLDLVQDCNTISLAIGDRRANARLMTSDEINNLVLIESGLAADNYATLRRYPEIGEPVSIASLGPFQRANLSGRLVAAAAPSRFVTAAGHLVEGTIAAVTGPGDDSRFLQISARLQAEDSGSPVLDASGNVVGIIDGEMGALVADELSDDDLEDVAFALRVNAIGRLAGAVHIPVAESAGSGRELTPGVLAERTMSFTALLSCDM